MWLKKFINFLILALSFILSEDYYKQEIFIYNHLVEKNDLDRIWVLRKVLSQLNVVEALEFLIDKMEKFKENVNFLNMMDK